MLGHLRTLKSRNFLPAYLLEAEVVPFYLRMVAFLRNAARAAAIAVLCAAAALGQALQAQQTAKATLDYSETLFSVLAVMNACGYDAELNSSEPLRAAVRNEMGSAVAHSDAAREAMRAACAFFRDHQQPDPNRELAQYVSLALNLGEPPDFAPLMKEADLPPDAAYVLGITGPLQAFYRAAGLHQIWEKHHSDYEAEVERFHQPVANLIMQTDLYLRLPISGYVGRRFVVYLEPMSAPGQVNARNYGADYFLVLAPAAGTLKVDQLRHTYLHFILDSLTLKRANSLRKVMPLLDAVKTAPMEDAYKHDPSLLVTESLIRAIEARMVGGGKASENARMRVVESAMTEGFVLTRYFYDQLAAFEKGPTGLNDAFGDMLYAMDVDREKKRAEETEFSKRAATEVVQAGTPTQQKRAPGLLDLAEDRLAKGDAEAAHRLAQQALEQKNDDPARALFILARAATLNADMRGARTYFERTLELAREPRMAAWSHIYLGRICDLQEERELAVTHYRAALGAGDPTPDTRAAAERGLQQAYQPPGKRE